jgi:hypothetical protein
MAAKKKAVSKKVDAKMLEENQELVDAGVEVGDEVVMEDEAPEETPAKKSKAGAKFEVWDDNGYIRTYDDEAVAKGFAGKVASRRIVEVK